MHPIFNFIYLGEKFFTLEFPELFVPDKPMFNPVC